MAWRTVVISNPARLRVENDQLVIAQDGETALPIEDIAVLMLESPEVSLSSSLLDRLASHGVTLIACDSRHLPSVAATPFAAHSRLAAVQRMQLDTSAPFRKRCWQSIVRQKITNQAMCLEILDRSGAAVVRRLAQAVSSGDAANIESTAAREHFRHLFGDDFLRGEEDATNAALNYGYAVIRASVARSLVAHGFLSSHGVHHRSELNQFNLADDFMEPFRPVVDLRVAEFRLGETLCKGDRQALVALLHCEVMMDGERQSLSRAAEISAGSYLEACREGNPDCLKLPQLLPIRLHQYE